MEAELEYSQLLFPFLSFKIKRKELLQVREWSNS